MICLLSKSDRLSSDLNKLADQNLNSMLFHLRYLSNAIQGHRMQIVDPE